MKGKSVTDDDGLEARLQALRYGRSQWVYMLVLAIGFCGVALGCGVFASRNSRDGLYGGVILFSIPGIFLLWLVWKTRSLAQRRK